MGVDPGLEHCYLPAGTAPPFNTGAPTCSSSSAQLGTLVVYNAVVAGIYAFTGHQVIRDRMPHLLRPVRWRPWGAVVTFVVNLVIMFIVTAIARSNGYPSDFWAIFSLWALRPRIGMVLWFCMAASLWSANRTLDKDLNLGGRHSQYFTTEPTPTAMPEFPSRLEPTETRDREDQYRSPYGWSFRDNMFFEGLTNLVAVLCATSLKGGMADDTYGCRIHGEFPETTSYQLIYASLNFTIFAAVVSVAAVVMLLFEVFMGDDDDRLSFPSFSFGDSIFCFSGGKTALYMVIFFVSSVGTFISNWVFWASKMANPLVSK